MNGYEMFVAPIIGKGDLPLSCLFQLLIDAGAPLVFQHDYMERNIAVLLGTFVMRRLMPNMYSRCLLLSHLP